MDKVKNVFWNDAQARLRTGWRIILLIAMFVAIVVAVQIGLSAIAYGIGIASGSIQPGEDPAAGSSRVASGSFVFVCIIMLVSIAVVFLIFWLAARWIDRRPFAEYGFHMGRGWWLDMVFGLALGAVLIAIMFGIELAAGWVTITGSFVTGDTGWSFAQGFTIAALTFIWVGCQEEVVFRSYFLKNLAEAIPVRWRGARASLLFGWVLSSIIFGLAHANNPNVTLVAIFNIFLAGLLLGLPYLLTGDVAVSIGLHITWNLFEGNVFGFPVSGTPANALSIIGISQTGPEVWTGGLFGPEAGLVAWPAMLIGAGLIVLYARWRKGNAGLIEALAEPPAPVVMVPANAKE